MIDIFKEFVIEEHLAIALCFSCYLLFSDFLKVLVCPLRVLVRQHYCLLLLMRYALTRLIEMIREGPIVAVSGHHPAYL